MKYSQAILVAVVGGAALAAAAPASAAAGSTSTVPAVKPTGAAAKPTGATVAQPPAGASPAAKPHNVKAAVQPGAHSKQQALKSTGQHTGTHRHHAGQGHRAGEHRVGEHRTGVHRTGEHRTGEHRTGEHRTGHHATTERNAHHPQHPGSHQKNAAGTHKTGKNQAAAGNVAGTAAPSALKASDKTVVSAPFGKKTPPVAQGRTTPAAPAPAVAQRDVEEFFERAFDEELDTRGLFGEGGLFSMFKKHNKDGHKHKGHKHGDKHAHKHEKPASKEAAPAAAPAAASGAPPADAKAAAPAAPPAGPEAPAAPEAAAPAPDAQAPLAGREFEDELDARDFFDEEDLFERDFDELDARSIMSRIKGAWRALRGKPPAGQAVDAAAGYPADGSYQRREFDEDLMERDLFDEEALFERDLLDEEELFERDLYDEEDLFGRDYSEDEEILARAVDILDALSAIKRTANEPRDFFEEDLELRDFDLNELD